jgi:hypothetical protein
MGESKTGESKAAMTKIEVATCLRIAAESLAAARFFGPSELDEAREAAAMAVTELPPDLAALVEEALSDGDFNTLDQIANAFEPPAALTPQRKSRRQRKPSVGKLIAQAEKFGKPVTSITTPDGVTLHFGTAESAGNEWDEVLPRHGKH